MLQNGNVLTNWLVFGVLAGGILISLGLLMKGTNGLFFARTINQFKEDQNNPNDENERNVGRKASNIILKYVSPIFIACLILLILNLLNII